MRALIRYTKMKTERPATRAKLARNLATLMFGVMPILLGACLQQPAPQTAQGPAATPPVTVQTTPSLTPSPTPSPTPTASENAPITMPVLDALFVADQGFVQALKERLQLTDEQIERLRTAAREETAKLREAGEVDQRSAAGARELARARLREIIGEEKLGPLAALVEERWSGGVDAAGSMVQPNAVPTDTRIVVNAPAYRMDVFENGRLVKSYRVAIGYPEFPLPTGLRKAETIIFNPTWTPPDEPWVEASNKVKPGQKVEAGSPLNPLGPVKIPIGLPSLIHGGKDPAKLGGFGSHGCVGLTNQQVKDFALLLARLGGAPLAPEQVAEYEKNKTETKNIKLAQPIPVELRYETIVVEDGKLHIYRDVYERGTNTEENLRRVLEAHGVRFDDLSDEEKEEVLQALDAMARNPKGEPVEEANPGNKKSTSARVTRTVRGAKEVVVEIAALRGKGYPAPVGLEDRPAKRTKAQRAAR